MGRLSVTTMPNVLAFDIGGTKIAWAQVSEDGNLSAFDSTPTPQTLEEILAVLEKVIAKHPKADAIGIGVPGPVSGNHQVAIFCTNIRALTGVNLVKELGKITDKPVVLDNDARCALLGEAWLGAAAETSSAVLLTIGTGVGGAVKQRGNVIPAPTDVSLEISRLPADPDDFFPGTTGRGTVESLIGGRSLEERYGISVRDMAQRVRKDDPDAVEFWEYVQHFFIQCVRAIYEAYGCRMIIIGGKGVEDIEYYVGTQEMPCEIVPAKLGSKAGLYGAAQNALAAAHEEAKDWDEE